MFWLICSQSYLLTLRTLISGSEETTNIASLLLITSLLAVTSVRLKNTAKKIWRPSKAEATAGFILHIKNDSDIQSAITSKQTKFQEYGLTGATFYYCCRGISWEYQNLLRSDQWSILWRLKYTVFSKSMF